MMTTHVHGTSSDQTSLQQLVRVLPHNLTILARAGLALIGIDDEIPWLGILLPVLEVHKTPLHPRREARTATSTQTRRFNLGNDPVVALIDNLLGLVPVAVLHGALEIGAVVAVQVLEDAVLVLQTALVLDGGGILYGGHATFLGRDIFRESGGGGGSGKGARGDGFREGGGGGGRGAESGLGWGGQHGVH